METTKKNAAKFRTLDAAKMEKVKGGIWVIFTKPDGTKEAIWV